MSEAEIGTMKTRNIIAIAIGISSLASVNLMAGPRVGVTVEVPAPAPPPVYSPPPGTVVETAVPDYYVWDGYEYVGVVNGQYYYLGPGNMWILMDEPRLYRFHDWERHHWDWRNHEIRNERYRHYNHEWREHHERGHDYDRDHHDRDHGRD